MYKEIEINTPLELARYLVNEGDLYEGDRKVRLSAVSSQHTTPFECRNTSGKMEEMRVFWRVDMFTFYKKLNWHDCIPEGKKVSCYVSNTTKNPREEANNPHCYIVSYSEEGDRKFVDSEGFRWRYATPIPADELWVPEL